MKPAREPTTTALVEADDFRSIPMLMAATKRSYNQVNAALWMLRGYRVVGVEVNADGKGWWYLMPAEGDTRCRCVAERVPESRKRKLRKGKVKDAPR